MGGDSQITNDRARGVAPHQDYRGGRRLEEWRREAFRGAGDEAGDCQEIIATKPPCDYRFQGRRQGIIATKLAAAMADRSGVSRGTCWRVSSEEYPSRP